MSECICGSEDGLHIKECPLWTNPFQDIHDLITNQQREIDMLHAENALKLTQILGLEQLLYETRIWDEEDKSPCWAIGCVMSEDGTTTEHNDTCIKARQATEPFWNGIKT